jgi:hypothetical protein
MVITLIEVSRFEYLYTVSRYNFRKRCAIIKQDLGRRDADIYNTDDLVSSLDYLLFSPTKDTSIFDLD